MLNYTINQNLIINKIIEKNYQYILKDKCNINELKHSDILTIYSQGQNYYKNYKNYIDQYNVNVTYILLNSIFKQKSIAFFSGFFNNLIVKHASKYSNNNNIFEYSNQNYTEIMNKIKIKFSIYNINSTKNFLYLQNILIQDNNIYIIDVKKCNCLSVYKEIYIYNNIQNLLVNYHLLKIFKKNLKKMNHNYLNYNYLYILYIINTV